MSSGNSEFFFSFTWRGKNNMFLMNNTLLPARYSEIFITEKKYIYISLTHKPGRGVQRVITMTTSWDPMAKFAIALRVLIWNELIWKKNKLEMITATVILWRISNSKNVSSINAHVGLKTSSWNISYRITLKATSNTWLYGIRVSVTIE